MRQRRPVREPEDTEVRAAIREWTDLMARGEYFEAHEVLEHPWLHATEPLKTFLKGLIHAAVALYQYRRGNDHGARVKYASCRRYLEPYAPRTRGVEVADLLGQMERFFAGLLAQPPGTPPPPPVQPWPVPRADPNPIDSSPAGS